MTYFDKFDIVCGKWYNLISYILLFFRQVLDLIDEYSMYIDMS